MNKKKKKKPQEQTFDFDLVEKWLENYFLDPLTSYYDQTQFQIDLYETEKEWIVEAILSDFTAADIKISLDEKKLIITASNAALTAKQQELFRSIEFPFQIMKQKVSATFSCGILEVFISKTEKEKEKAKKRYIPLS